MNAAVGEFSLSACNSQKLPLPRHSRSYTKQSCVSYEHQHHDKIVVLLLGMTLSLSLSLSLSLMGPTGEEEDGCGERAVHQGVTSETTEFQCVVLCAWFTAYENASSSSC
jgi:hypothetical protein